MVYDYLVWETTDQSFIHDSNWTDSFLDTFFLNPEANSGFHHQQQNVLVRFNRDWMEWNQFEMEFRAGNGLSKRPAGDTLDDLKQEVY